ncbi:lysine exporter protein (LYSE/YGGA) [Sulfurimonas gotlandica GD1]|uniref:Lysine exporter protein (LYSE/YGGA) n=1 Tax=Sulfurimonas gotlandica (strain DSM 19862 / JCM 16533 / GD1) TaxID=929558 RepID=B6BHP8_SULGG|nr:LysE family transporter [Sulfurimonas gotlandica]EDZ62971.1 transporter, LysE family [Sulfurimonas gotlandica GD1]EHP30047.1 lysine exporter protein (LYSE/YGGA) [Sulfurimonas gotlandica GD1]
MILSFTEGFLLGLGAAVPLGPINILIMNEAVKKYKNGVMIGLGAMSSDIMYLFLIIFGLIAFFNQPYILNSLSLFGGAFLIYLAYAIFKNRDTKIGAPKEEVKESSCVKLYAKGFILTAINPYTIGFWLSVSGYIAGKELNPYIALLGMLSAILLWITLMPYLVHRTKHKISRRVSHWISIASAVILFGFGSVMIIKLIS